MGPDEMTPAKPEIADDPLSAIERGIGALEDPGALLRRLDECREAATLLPGDRVRYLLARGIVENRASLPRSSVASLLAAREAAMESGARERLPAIALELARVHAWRGDTKTAALELLQSVAGSILASSEESLAAAIAECARLNLEGGRYDAAIATMDVAAALPAAQYTERERVRLIVNRCQALAVLARWEECLQSVRRAPPDARARLRREDFLLLLEEARALHELGRTAEAAAVAARAASALPANRDAFEIAEFRFAEGFLKRKSDPREAEIALRFALERFVDDDLARREIETRVILAEVLASLGQRSEAEACVVEALRRAEARQLPALGDRVRAAAVRFWRPDRIASLGAEAALVADSPNEEARFLLLESAGAGGFATVQRAVDLDSGAFVAIKRLKIDATRPSAELTFAFETVRNEISIANRLRGLPIACTHYLHVTEAGEVLIVQDYIEGPTLRRALEGGLLPRRSLYAVLASLARTIASLHAAGVSHRDLKPDNVILRRGVPVLIDLGIASVRGQRDATRGAGTPQYAPPEQLAAGASADPALFGREDVFALGRMTEEILLGRSMARRRWRSPVHILAMWGGALAAIVVAGKPRDGVEDAAARMTAAEPAERKIDLLAFADLLDRTAAQMSADAD